MMCKLTLLNVALVVYFMNEAAAIIKLCHKEIHIYTHTHTYVCKFCLNTIIMRSFYHVLTHSKNIFD